MARQMRSGVAGIVTSVTPSGARASRIAFITVGVEATVPPSPTPLAPNGCVVLGRAEIDGDPGHRVGARDAVIQQRAGQQLAAVAVVDDVLRERLPGACATPPWIYPHSPRAG
jgi:hypothetical protein